MNDPSVRAGAPQSPPSPFGNSVEVTPGGDEGRLGSKPNAQPPPVGVYPEEVWASGADTFQENRPTSVLPRVTQGATLQAVLVLVEGEVCMLKGVLVDVDELEPGQWLQTSAGSWLQITAVQARTQNAAVHNLTVADTHTYYVLAGAKPVLAHN